MFPTATPPAVVELLLRWREPVHASAMGRGGRHGQAGARSRTLPARGRHDLRVRDRRKRSPTGGPLAATTTNQKLKDWVEHWAGVFQPDVVEWCDGSEEEWERLTQLLIDGGTFDGLNEAKR